MNIADYAVPPTTAPRALSLADLAARTLGATVTWAELIPLIEQADHLIISFPLQRNGEPSRGGVEVAKDKMLARARDGIGWALRANEQQRLHVNAAGTTLWIG